MGRRTPRVKWEHRTIPELSLLRVRAEAVEDFGVALRHRFGLVFLGFWVAVLTFAVSIKPDTVQDNGRPWFDIATWLIIGLWALGLALDIAGTLAGRRLDRIIIGRRMAAAFASSEAFRRAFGFDQGDER